MATLRCASTVRVAMAESQQPPVPLHSQLAAEFVGTAFLLAGVVGSGIMAERLSDDIGLQLFENAVATGALLVALILTFGPVSGAHFNPAVTIAARALGTIDTATAGAYIALQTLGAIAGTIIANLMFDLPAVEWSTKPRDQGHLVFAEGVATFGLLVVIFVMVRSNAVSTVAYAVGGYITAAYWFTSSTSFANPAVTIARMFSDTFAGIAPGSAIAFIIAQLLATGVAIFAVKLIVASPTTG